MTYELPSSIRMYLAQSDVRLHHLLWHVIRDSWHNFTPSQRKQMEDNHPGWVPKIPRFVNVAPTPQNPSGIGINFDAGESFLYMHRQMIQEVNYRLRAENEPELVPWVSIPEVDDPEYPVPGRVVGGDRGDVKSDAHLEVMKQRAAAARDSGTLQQITLARLGAYVESAVHDFMHMRWAGDPGVMSQFPPVSPTNPNPNIPNQFDAVDVDYLGHPYSSHVNSTFWKLHGWIDDCIEEWRIANGLDEITWHDTWVGGDASHHDAHLESATESDPHHHGHGHHGMLEVFRTIKQFEGCHATFSYVHEMGLSIPDSLKW